MRMRGPFLALLLVLAVVVGACGSQADETKGSAVMEGAADVGARAAAPTPAAALAAASDEEAAEGSSLEREAAMAEPVDAAADASANEAAAGAMDEPVADPTPGEAAAGVMPDDQPAMAETVEAVPAEPEVAEEEARDLPAWLTAPLIDVNTGESFTVAGFDGKVVLVETLAVWCSNCLKQQREVKALHELLGARDDLVSVGLDIDLNESPAQLRSHAERNGFDWVYAVATPEVAREIGQLYGVNFLNPPSTPMLIIDRDGNAHPLPFGIKSAEALQQALAPFLAG